jgi:hypothetical protein
MDKKTKLLIILFVLLAGMSVGYSFYDTVVMQNYEVIIPEGLEE